MKKHYVMLALIAIGMNISCQQGRTDADETEEDSVVVEDTLFDDSLYYQEEEVGDLQMPVDHAEAFSDFIFSFLKNRRFQASRIKFPLNIVEMDGSERQITSGVQFRREFVLPNEDCYTMLVGHRDEFENFQNDMDLDNVSWQMIDLHNTHVSSYNFVRTDGHWLLMDEKRHLAEQGLSDFLHFYHRFTNDSIFQQASISQPLSIFMIDPEDEISSIEGTIEAEQWPSFRPEMPSGVITNIDFGQDMSRTNRIVLLQCGISNGMLDVFTFAKEGENWKLVSYEN